MKTLWSQANKKKNAPENLKIANLEFSTRTSQTLYFIIQELYNWEH
jgi:hypothetical protein